MFSSRSRHSRNRSHLVFREIGGEVLTLVVRAMADPPDRPSAATRRVLRECSPTDSVSDPFDTHLHETAGASPSVSSTTARDDV